MWQSWLRRLFSISLLTPTLVLVIVFQVQFTLAQAPVTGAITGTVREAGTQKPLAGATIEVVGLNLGTATDSAGIFRLLKLPTQSIILQVSGVGYQTAYAYDVMVTSGNTVQLSFELEPQTRQLAGVEVKRNRNFIKPAGSVNSIQTLGYNEIAKYPGANFDIAKVVQSLPGVSGSVGFRNDIIIRGGAPNENVYYLDGIEIPTINHFATQGAAGGPVGMLNVAFVDQVVLHTSAFPAKYDNPLSGALQFRQRTGNPDKIEGNLRTSASEVALTLEGPLNKKGTTTFLASARRSYLQLLFKLIELPFLPDYWDYQYKITHKPDTKNEISLLGIGSIDNFSFLRPQNPTLEQQAILDGLPLNTQWTTTAGVYWKHLLNNGFWQLSLSKNILNNTADKWEDNEKPSPDTRVLAYRSREDENRLRYEYNKVVNGFNLSVGANLIQTNYSNSTYQRRVGYEADYNTSIRFWRYGLFAQAGKRLLAQKLAVTLGLRADGNTFTNEGNNIGRTLSPRLALAYTLAPGLNLNTSIGRYFKITPYTILGYKENGLALNQNSRYIQSDHLVAGLEYSPSNATRITLEGFRKWYRNYPVSRDRGISMANLGGDFGIFGNEQVLSTGRGRTYGLEFTYQQQLVKNFYGILAYTWYYSQFTGANPQVFTPSAWDNRHLISFTGGYKFKRNWEVGVRWRYQGKAPATPYNEFLSLELYPFTGEAQLDWANVNTLRLDAFNAMDLRIDKKWNFRKWSLNLFLDIQNVYNSLNPTQPGFTLQRNPDGSIATRNGEAYNPGSFANLQAPNNRQQAIPVILAQNSGSRLPSIGFVIGF